MLSFISRQIEWIASCECWFWICIHFVRIEGNKGESNEKAILKPLYVQIGRDQWATPHEIAVKIRSIVQPLNEKLVAWLFK